MSQDDWKFTAPTDLPETVKAIILKPMLVDGIYGLGCSPDNGVTNRVYWTIYGRKYYQEDADRLWPLLIDKVKSVVSIDWDSIQNKPKLVTQDELENRLAKLSVPTINWADIQNKPDVALHSDLPDMSNYVTQDQLTAPVNLSGYAKINEVQTAQSTANNANQAANDNAQSIKQLSNRIDAIKIPDLSGYAKTSQIPTDVVTHAELTTTKWLDTGTTWLNGNTGSIQYRSITVGNYHIVEVTGSMYITTKAYAITSAFKIPLFGFEDSTTMHFSGGSTITNEIPVAFMAGAPGEVKLYTWQNVNNGWTEVHLSWTYVGGGD